MALLQVNYVSQALMHQVALNVILPVDEFASESSPYRPERKFPTLYLLHGLLGNYGDWVAGTRVKRWAETHGLAVVMPSGDNSFYVDNPKASGCSRCPAGGRIPLSAGCPWAATAHCATA